MGLKIRRRVSAVGKLRLTERCGDIMRKFRKLGAALIAAAVLPMAACGSSMPELTEEQNRLIVEYAAGLLLKYDENYHGRIVEIEEEPAPVEEPETAVEEPAAEEPEEQEAAEAVENPQAPDEVQMGEEIAEKSIEEFYGIEGVTIAYTGYEIKDTYPEVTEDNLFFAMNASAGAKLLVFSFDVTNVSGQDLNLDMAAYDTKFKISINGESPKYILTTMLLDDLASFTGTIPAGASEKLVLVSEIPEEESGSIQTISLLMKNALEDAQLTLN